MTSSSPEIGKTLTVDGVRINFHDQGQGDAVLLIHGSGPGVTAWANWRTILPVLAETHRVIAPDMAGFGYTETPADFDATPAAWVRQVIGLLDALGLQKVTIIGNSFGGAIALKTASLHPDRVDRLVLMGSVGTPFPITEGLQKVWGYQPSHEAMNELLHIFAYDHSIISDDLVDMRYRASIRADVQDRFAALFPEPRQAGVEMLALSDAELAAIDIPVVAIHGRDDQVIPFSVSEALVRKLPRAELHPIDACGHWVQIEKAPEFLDIVTGFLGAGDDRAAQSA
ncbi:MAG: alpha/beta fold hydrolase [Pseudodonghicola sp.]